MDTQTCIICIILLTVASLGIDFQILDSGLFLEDTVHTPENYITF